MYAHCCSLYVAVSTKEKTGENPNPSSLDYRVKCHRMIPNVGCQARSLATRVDACARTKHAELLLCPGKNPDGGHVFTNSSLNQKLGEMAGQDTVHSVNLQCLIGSQEQKPWQLW